MANIDGNSGAAESMPMFYKDVRPVEPQTMASYGLKRGGDMKFAATAHAIPVLFGELHLVQKHYPIVFASGNPNMPIAVVGLQQNENLFVEDDGTWALDTYVPLYVRRYPFILAEAPPQNPEETRMVLCVDVAAPTVVSSNPDMPFYVGTEPGDIIKGSLEFCKHFQAEYLKTLSLTRELHKLELFRQVEVKFDVPNGQQVTAGSVITIDHDRFNTLPDDVVLDLHKKNFLPLLHMQITSQSNWQRVANRKQMRLNKANAN